LEVVKMRSEAKWRGSDGWAFNVKVHQLPRSVQNLVDALDECDQERVEELVHMVWWDRIDEEALAIGFSGVVQVGRSGGHLVPMLGGKAVGGWHEDADGVDGYHTAREWSRWYAGAPEVVGDVAKMLAELGETVAAALSAEHIADLVVWAVDAMQEEEAEAARETRALTVRLVESVRAAATVEEGADLLAPFVA
jgi:hypothetical protein